MGHPFNNGYEKKFKQPLYGFLDGLHIISTHSAGFALGAFSLRFGLFASCHFWGFGYYRDFQDF